MKQLNFILALLCLSFLSMNAQNVGINDDNSNADANAILDVKSTTKGVLFPRLTTAQRTTLGNLTPTEGMLVFDTEVKSYFFFGNGAWVELAASNSEVPVGTILAYGASTLPSGYLACDGSAVSNASTYADLFATIGTTWGGDGTPNFNLPDFRGRFPRGWDNGAGNDPDAASRTALHVGGNSADNVGSYQADEFESHTHTEKFYEDINPGQMLVPPGDNVGSITTHNSGSAGGSETRPKNAYVHYIIKY